MRLGQVGRVQRFLGVLVAAGDAIAAAHTGVEQAWGNFCANRPAERHSQIGRLKSDLNLIVGIPGNDVAEFLQSPVLLGHAVNRFHYAIAARRVIQVNGAESLGAELCAGFCKGRVPARLSWFRFQVFRPRSTCWPILARCNALVKHATVRLYHHIGIDQAGPPQTIAHQCANAVAHSNFEQAGLVAHDSGGILAVDPESTECIAKVVRKLLGQPFLAALQNQHPDARLRQTQRTDRTAIARADDDRVVDLWHRF